MYRLAGVAPTFGASGQIVYLGGGLRNGFTATGGMPRKSLVADDLRTGRFTR